MYVFENDYGCVDSFLTYVSFEVKMRKWTPYSNTTENATRMELSYTTAVILQTVSEYDRITH
jgi:hypothetical protein